MQTEKSFYFTHIAIGRKPVIITDVIVHATAYIENGEVYDTMISDIVHKGISIHDLCKIISPDFIEECNTQALRVAHNNYSWSSLSELKTVAQENGE